MLNVTLDKNDFFMIGDDIRVQYRKNSGDGKFTIAISVPDDVKIVRGGVYEQSLEKLAAEGDTNAQAASDILAQEKEIRQHMVEHKRANLQRIKEHNERTRGNPTRS